MIRRTFLWIMVIFPVKWQCDFYCYLTCRKHFPAYLKSEKDFLCHRYFQPSHRSSVKNYSILEVAFPLFYSISCNFPHRNFLSLTTTEQQKIYIVVTCFPPSYLFSCSISNSAKFHYRNFLCLFQRNVVILLSSNYL